MPNRRHPDPSYTPPNEAELELGYFLDCPGCDRRWSKRYVDRFVDRCIGCARAWRRNDRMSRRRGLGGVPLVTHPPPHPFQSQVMRREVDLNDPEVHRLLTTNDMFRAEVGAYVAKIIATNARPKPALYGVLPLLSAGRGRGKAQRVEVQDEPLPETVPSDVAAAVARHIDAVMGDTIEGEIVVEKKPRKGR